MQIYITVNKEIVEIPFLFWMKPLGSGNKVEYFQCQIDITANKEINRIPFLFWMQPLRS